MNRLLLFNLSEAWVINASPVILLAKAGLLECVSSLAETFVVPTPVADELFHEALRRAGEQPWK